MYRILLLSESTLADHDVTRVAQLHGDEEVEVHLLVPADAEHNRLIEALDEDDDPTPQQAEQDAMHAVNESLDKLVAAGLTARGSVTGSDPVPAALEAVRLDSSDEVIVVAPPHPVESALHRDWASRLRDRLPLPVLHAVSGTDRLIG